MLLVFSFNNSQVPSFPLSGFTLHWYHQFVDNGDLRATLVTSALIALISSVGAVVLGTLASFALARRRFRAKALVSAPPCPASMTMVLISRCVERRWPMGGGPA